MNNSNIHGSREAFRMHRMNRV